MSAGDKQIQCDVSSATLEDLASERDIELRREFEPIAFSDYDNDPTTKRQFFWLSYTSKVLASLDGQGRLLDIGSNIPWLVGVAAQYNVTMVDVRAHPLGHVLPFPLIEANATDLPFEDHYFDIVTLPQVLHWVGTGTYGDAVNVNGDLQTLDEVARVLVPGGVAIFTTFVVPDKTVFKLSGRRLFGLSDLKAMMQDRGLEILDLKICNADCEQITEGEIPQISDRILSPGNPDEDLAWAIGVVRATA